MVSVVTLEFNKWMNMLENTGLEFSAKTLQCIFSMKYRETN